MKKSSNNRIEEITKELFYIYRKIQSQVENKISDFKNIWQNGSDEDLFTELSFCILTPQSKALEAWKAITSLTDSGELFLGRSENISKELNRVRFKNNKARYLVSAREIFSNGSSYNTRNILNKAGDTYGKRKWLVENVKGIG